MEFWGSPKHTCWAIHAKEVNNEILYIHLHLENSAQSLKCMVCIYLFVVLDTSSSSEDSIFIGKAHKVAL